MAVKILRPEHRQSEDPPAQTYYEAFADEVEFLDALQDTEAVTPLLEWGFVELREAQFDDSVLHVSKTSEEFRAALPEARTKGWLPYLVLGYTPYRSSLLAQLRIPVEEPGAQAWPPLADRLQWASAALQTFHIFHERRYGFRDHKLEHVVLFGQRAIFIDWNSSEHAPKAGEGAWAYRVWEDVRWFFAAVIHPMFAHRMIGGAPIGPLLIAFPTGDRAAGLYPNDRGLVPLFEGESELSEEIRRIISAGFAHFEARAYRSAGEASAAFDSVAARLRATPAMVELEEVLGEIAQLQVELDHLLSELRARALGKPNDRETAALLQQAARLRRMRVLPDGSLRRNHGSYTR